VAILSLLAILRGHGYTNCLSLDIVTGDIELLAPPSAWTLRGDCKWIGSEIGVKCETWRELKPLEAFALLSQTTRATTENPDHIMICRGCHHLRCIRREVTKETRVKERRENTASCRFGSSGQFQEGWLTLFGWWQPALYYIKLSFFALHMKLCCSGAQKKQLSWDR
jgi:hypothetical protein